MQYLNKENYFNRHLNNNEVNAILNFLKNEYGNLANEDVLIDEYKQMFTADLKNYFLFNTKNDLLDLYNDLLLEGGLDFQEVKNYVLNEEEYEDVIDELKYNYDEACEYNDYYDYDNAKELLKNCFNYELFFKDLEVLALNYFNYEEVNGLFFRKFNFNNKEYFQYRYYFDLNGDVFYYGEHNYLTGGRVKEIKSYTDYCLDKIKVF